jgi:hypothetical protein
MLPAPRGPVKAPTPRLQRAQARWYGVEVRRLLRLVTLLSVLGITVVVVRSLQRQAPLGGSLNGSGPLVGSLDTWPPVPKAPAKRGAGVR